jgi:hypothetical protein
MKNRRVVGPLCVLTALVCLCAFAQDSPVKGRSSIELNFGLWAGPSVSNSTGLNSFRAEAKAGAFVGGLVLTHWVQEYLSVTVSGGLLAGKASSSVNLMSVSQHVSSVVPVLLGVRYYALGSTADGNVRPYLSAAVGPYIGSEVNNTILSQESRSESAFGGRLGAGIDFFLGDHFKVGANAGYNVMGDFSAPVGARSNYSGADFSCGIGYIF